MAKIGVFDSGVGGLSVTRAIQKALPDHDVVYANDSKNVPYGDKAPELVFNLVLPILQDLVTQGCQVIVIACNTVTTGHIERLRKIIPVPLIGVEPMVKSAAAATKTGVIAVCATPATLVCSRYQWLKDTYASGKTVIEPDCSQWASMIEHNTLNEARIAQQIDDVCNAGADIIVLACTHYHWIEEKICAMAKGRANVMQPESAIVAELTKTLASMVQPA